MICLHMVRVVELGGWDWGFGFGGGWVNGVWGFYLGGEGGDE